MPQFSLRLFHGRDDPDENLDEWGFDGPVLGPFDSIRLTYCSLILCFDEQRFELRRVDDLLFYDGKFYGDASIELASEEPPTEQFDETKAERDLRSASVVPSLIPLRSSELRNFRACVEVFVDSVSERVSESAGMRSAEALRRVVRQR